MHHDVIIYNLSLFNIDISITKNVVILWLSALLVFTLFFIASRKPKKVPNLLQGILEVILETLDSAAESLLGSKVTVWLPFLIALFCFILFCNLFGLIPGLSSPTSSISVTATLAVLVFIVVQIYGITQLGFFKYVKHLVPEGAPLVLVPFFFLIEIVLQLAKPFSLAIRLFANIFAGHTTMLIILGLIVMVHHYLLYFLPILGYVLVALFEIMMGTIQAFIFTFLTASYLAEVAGEPH